MAGEKKDKPFFDSLFPKLDSDVLIQECKGLIIRVEDGYKLALQKNNRVDVYGTGYVFRWPWQLARLTANHSLNREFEYKDALKTRDNITVAAASSIKYKFRGNGNPSGVRMLNSQPNADANIVDFVQDIVTTIVRNSNHEMINHAFDVTPSNIPSWLDSITKLKIKHIFYVIKNDYGCEIELIHMCDFNDPQTVIEAENEAKAQSIRNKTALEKAQTEFKIEQYKLLLENIKQNYNYSALYNAAKMYNLSSSDIRDILKRQVTQTNSTIIEGGLGLDAILGALMTGFRDYALKQREISTRDSGDKSEPIDADYSEGGKSI